jgi:hypothetical protein
MVGLTINRKPVTNNVFNDSRLNRRPNRKYLTLVASITNHDWNNHQSKLKTKI